MTSSSDGAAGISRDAFIYGLASLITQGTLLLAIPVYSRILGPAGFGVVELLVVGLQLLALVAMGGFDLAAIRLFYAADNLAERRRMVSTGLLGVSVAALVGTGAVVMFTGQIERSYLQDFEAGESVLVGAVALPLFVAARYAREAYRAQRRPWAYLVNSSTAGLLQVGIGIALIGWFEFGPEGVMVGYLVAAAVTLLMSLVGSRSLFGLEFAAKDLRDLLGYGIPLVWVGLAGWSLMFVDRLVLSAFVGVDDVGIYALASRMGMALTLVIYSFTRAWTPAMLEVAEADRDRERSTRIRVLRPYMANVAIVAVAISLLADPIVRLIAGSEFIAAADLVPIISVGLLFFALVPVIQMPMLIEQRTGVLAWGSLAAAVFNLVLNLALVPSFGTAAAAWSTLLALALQSLIYWWAAGRVDATAYSLPRTGLLVMLAAAFCALSWLPYPSGALGLITRLAVAGGFPVAVVLSGAVRVTEARDALAPVYRQIRDSLQR